MTIRMSHTLVNEFLQKSLAFWKQFGLTFYLRSAMVALLVEPSAEALFVFKICAVLTHVRECALKKCIFGHIAVPMLLPEH